MIPVYCPLCCDQPFEDQDGLFHHLRSLRNNLFCPICSERFSSFDQLIIHLSRKCHGPVSPHEAKRKCLFDKKKLPDTLDVPPLVSPSSFDRENAQGEVPIESSQADVSETTGSAVICDPVEAASPAPSLLPAELRNRLPRGVTVSISPSDTVSPPQNSYPDPSILSSLLENKKSAKDSSVKPTKNNNSLNAVLNKVSLNPNVQISVNASKDSESTSKKSVVLGSPSKDSLSVSIIASDTENSSPPKRSGKAGPLSTKLKRNISLKKSLVVEKYDQLSSKVVSDLDSKSESNRGNETNSKEEGNLSVQNKHSKKGKRDGLKKTPIKVVDNESRVVNGVMNQEKSSLETPVNEKRSRRVKVNCSSDLPEEVSNKRSVRTRGKKIEYSKLINSDDSDNFEDNASCGSDADYEPEEPNNEPEEPIRSLEKVGHKSEKYINGPSKGRDKKTEEITKEEPEKTKAEPKKRIELEKSNVESEKSPSKVTKTGEGAEHKDSSSVGVKKRSSKVTKTGEGAEHKDSSSVGVPKTAEGAEHKDSSSVGVPETAEGDEPKDSSSVEETKTEEEEEYTCSACNIRFTSIYEHIKEYHNGQEVVVEVPEEEIKEDLKAYQESSESLVSIGESESKDTPAIEIDETVLVPSKEEKSSPPKGVRHSRDSQSATKSGEKRKKEIITGFAAEGASNNLLYTRSFRKVKKDTGEHWVQLQSDNRKLYQFIRDEDKYQRLMTELRNNTSIHPDLKMPIKKLFENPKINVVEITNEPNSPFLTHRTVNFKNPMPMFIVDRQTTNDPSVLGGIASYIMAGKETSTAMSATEDSKVIGVMKVILASDKELTVENIVFNDKPANPDMVPVLEDVKTPDIPLLKDSKILKWRCNKCLATTWKFPLHKETHYCNACPICHKTFMSPVSLKKHLVLHKRDGTKYCKDCRAAFINKALLNSHLDLHITHILCDKCHLFVLRDKIEEHTEIHSRDASEQFPCSICKKVFGTGKDLKNHESKLCSKLVAKFSCTLCDKKFFSLTALSYHTSAHNNVAIKLSCRFCPKTFIQEKEQCPKMAGKRKPSSYIQKIWHERIHTRDRPYMCKSCPKRFRSMEYEVQHNNLVHASPNSTPLRNVHVHMCTYCDRVFRSEKQLANHMTQHTSVTAE